MNILGILIAILVLGILIMVHELGHFLLAKATGIAVDEFSLGFGKEIIGFTKGETRYRIGWIPFGGYCKMRGEESKDRNKKGESDKDKKDGEAVEEKAEEKAPEKTEEALTEKDPHAMYNRPAWARVLAILGGSLFNYLFAVVIMILLFMFGFKEDSIVPRVHVIEENEIGEATPAYLAGLKSGDTILQIGEKNIVSYSDIAEAAALGIDEELDIVFLRNGATNFTTLTPIYDEESGLGDVGVTPIYTTTVAEVATNTPAETAGLQAWDKIISIDGVETVYFHELAEALESRPTQEVVLMVKRPVEDAEEEEYETLTLNVKLAETNGVGFLGIYPGEVVSFEEYKKAKNFFNAFAVGFVEANKLLKRVLDGMGALFSGKINIQKNISGPIRIIQFTGKIATGTSFVTLLQFMALISVALGFFNFLPLPGLDGGHFVINTFEMVTTIKPPDKVLTIIENVGLIFLIGLSVLILLSDIVNIALGR